MSNIEWPADTVSRCRITQLAPYARNSRVHSTEQVEQIAASMLANGVTNAVLVDEDGNIIAGHGRVLAAEYLVASGHAKFEELPVITAKGWTGAQKAAYVIADNKLALNADWDVEVLTSELQKLMEDGYDVDLTGFSEDEISKLLPDEVGDMDEPDDFGPEDSGESSTGTQNNALKFNGKSIPMSQDEVDRLMDRLDHYVAERGVTFGFVGNLLDAAVLGGR